jgi:hypothetical protein
MSASAWISGAASARKALNRVEAQQIVLHRARAQARAQSQPSPAFGQCSQPRLGQAVEPQMHAGVRPLAGASGQAGQPMQAPDLTGILHVPADAVTQGFNAVAREDQKPLVGPLFRACPLTPLLGGQVEQRAHPGVFGSADGPGDDRRRGGDRGLVVAALNRVLQFEFELGRQPVEVDARDATLLAVREVFHVVGAAQLSPSRRVGFAVEVPGVFGPHGAERQRTLLWIRGTEQARLGRPGAPIRSPGTNPRCPMPRA